MGKSVVCNLCKECIPSNDAFHCHSGGNVTYECMNTSECNKLRNVIKNESKNNPVLRNLSKEEQFKKLYEINFSDLVEYKNRFRDGSIHYIYKPNNEIYSWNFLSGSWSKGNDYITKIILGENCEKAEIYFRRKSEKAEQTEKKLKELIEKD